jgi:hypothetical protein
MEKIFSYKFTGEKHTFWLFLRFLLNEWATCLVTVKNRFNKRSGFSTLITEHTQKKITTNRMCCIKRTYILWLFDWKSIFVCLLPLYIFDVLSPLVNIQCFFFCWSFDFFFTWKIWIFPVLGVCKILLKRNQIQFSKVQKGFVDTSGIKLSLF